MQCGLPRSLMGNMQDLSKHENRNPEIKKPQVLREAYFFMFFGLYFTESSRGRPSFLYSSSLRGLSISIVALA